MRSDPLTIGAACSLRGPRVPVHDQGRYDEAEPLNLETLEVKKRVLGEEHPDTLLSMNNIADLSVLLRAAPPAGW